MDAKLNYPVLCYNPSQSSIEAFANEDEATTWSWGGLRERVQDDLFLVDSNLFSYRVVEAVPEGDSHLSIFGFSIPRMTRVHLKLSEPTQLTLSAVKDRLFTVLENDVEFWESGGDLAELKGRIRESPDLSTIIAIFAG